MTTMKRLKGVCALHSQGRCMAQHRMAREPVRHPGSFDKQIDDSGRHTYLERTNFCKHVNKNNGEFFLSKKKKQGANAKKVRKQNADVAEQIKKIVFFHFLLFVFLSVIMEIKRKYGQNIVETVRNEAASHSTAPSQNWDPHFIPTRRLPSFRLDSRHSKSSTPSYSSGSRTARSDCCFVLL